MYHDLALAILSIGAAACGTAYLYGHDHTKPTDTDTVLNTID